jgi:hypothetical protein
VGLLHDRSAFNIVLSDGTKTVRSRPPPQSRAILKVIYQGKHSKSGKAVSSERFTWFALRLQDFKDVKNILFLLLTFKRR